LGPLKLTCAERIDVKRFSLFLFFTIEPCCALKYYPEIEICVKEQKGEQVSLKHYFVAKLVVVVSTVHVSLKLLCI